MPPRRPSRRVIPGALLLSLALHALLGAWWASRTPTPSPPYRRPSAIEVEIVLTPPPPPPAEFAPSEQPPNPPTPPPRLATPRKVPKSPPLAADTPEELPPEPEAAPTDAPVASDAPLAASDAPIAFRPDGLKPSPFQTFGLPDDNAVGSPDAGVVRVPTSEDPDFLAHLVQDDMARAKVKRGIAHSYYGELGKALVKAWDAERGVDRSGLSGFLEQSVERMQEFSKIFAKRAQQYARTGSPVDMEPGTKRTANAVPNGADSALDSLDVRRRARQEMRQAYNETRRAEVRVTQDGTGRLLMVELIKPSNDAEVDRAALDDVRSAAELLPTPPEEAVGDDDRLISVWQFELIVSISPPAPIVTFTFDEVLGNFDARLPLDRRIYKRVQLLAVY